MCPAGAGSEIEHENQRSFAKLFAFTAKLRGQASPFRRSAPVPGRNNLPVPRTLP